MTLPSVELIHTQYYPETVGMPPVRLFDVEMTEAEHEAMARAHLLAEQAFLEGNPPVGAVVFKTSDPSKHWEGQTVDRSRRTHGRGHAEQIATDKASDAVQGTLEDYTLVTTAQPCTSCTPPIAENKYGRVVFAAPRGLIYPLTGIMRPRRINFHELMEDGDTHTLATSGFQASRSLAKFAVYGYLRKQGIVDTGSPSTATQAEIIAAAIRNV